MALVLSDEFLAKAKLTEQEVWLELSLVLYQKQRISLGKAAEMAGINRLQMQSELKKRNIFLNITPEDVKKDVEALQNLDIL